MTFGPGTRLGTYEVLGLLGAGGMGEVYRARDASLKREVAIKVLPQAFSGDVERVARFQREAEVLASLNHPSIGAIYGLGEFESTRFLVLELIEGDTLADRIARGPLTVAEALAIARQIADSLEAAHDKGIVHRDLKPANVKITPDGKVKVVDFGLARIAEAAGAAIDVSNSPTVMATRAGTIMGTAAYMSPEQAMGRDVDRAADLWAFGCVLYEMLTARRAFPGDTTAEILAGVIKTEPDWRALPADTPPAVTRLLQRCLRKDRHERLRDAGAARIEILDVTGGIVANDSNSAYGAPHMAETTVSGRPPVLHQPRGRLLGYRVTVAALALALGVLAALWWRGRSGATPPELRLEITTPPNINPRLAISPDGRQVVFIARSGSLSQLWVRSLDSPVPTPVPGTERALSAFWSPDSRSLGVFADETLKQVDLKGGTRRLASTSASPLGGAWSSNGTIIYGISPGRGLVRLAPDGGDPVPVTTFGAGHRSHSSPRFLPDGRHFVFFVDGEQDVRGVYLGQLDDVQSHRLFEADTPAEFSPAGYLLFGKAGTLLAHRFNPDSQALSGDPLPVAEYGNNTVVVSASTVGPIVYRTSPPMSSQRQFVWMKRDGTKVREVTYVDSASQGPALSPDGRHIAVFRDPGGNMDIWLFDVVRETWERATFATVDDILPLWSPDGREIIFSSNRDKVMSLYRKLIGSPANSEVKLPGMPGNGIVFPMDWSRDGRFVLFTISTKATDIWALPLGGDGKAIPVLQTEFTERAPQFSMDGHWIAYESNKSGRFEVYLQPFPGPGREYLISTAGGAQPRWNQNGRELFYIGQDDRLMAVPIRFSTDSATADVGAPEALFATNVGSTALNTIRQQYVVMPDGQTFVMNSVLDEAAASPIVVILNWKPER